MSHFKVGTFNSIPKLKQVSKHEYYINLEKVYKELIKYINIHTNLNDNIILKKKIISYTIPNINVDIKKDLKASVSTLVKNFKIYIYYQEKGNCKISFQSKSEIFNNNIFIDVNKKKKLKKIDLNNYLVIKSRFPISFIKIKGVLLASNNTNIVNGFPNIYKLKKLVFNDNYKDIEKIVEKKYDNMSTIEIIDWIRSEFTSILYYKYSSDVNSYIVHDICNKLEKKFIKNFYI